MNKLLTCCTLVLAAQGLAVQAQSQLLSLDDAIGYSLNAHPDVRAAELSILEMKESKKAISDVPKTEVSWTHGQYNSYVRSDNNFTISQHIPFPTVWASQSALGSSLAKSSELQMRRVQNDLVYKVSIAYVRLAYHESKKLLLVREDSIYSALLRTATIRHKAGEGTVLERMAAESESRELKNQMRKNESDIVIYRTRLRLLMNREDLSFLIPELSELKLTSVSGEAENNPGLIYAKQQEVVAKNEHKVEQNKTLPEITVGYFNQSMIGYQPIDGQEVYFGSGDRFTGFQLGLSIPLWFRPYHGKTRAASYRADKAKTEILRYETELASEMITAKEALEKSLTSLRYYEEVAVPNAAQLVHQSTIAYNHGEIDYITHLSNIKHSLTIANGHLFALEEFHLSQLSINWLNGNKEYLNQN